MAATSGSAARVDFDGNRARHRPVSPRRRYNPSAAVNARYTTVAALRSSGAQIHVATRHGESVRFPHRRHDDDLAGHVQVPNHAPHDGNLLAVFLPEVRAIRLHDIEQLEPQR